MPSKYRQPTWGSGPPPVEVDLSAITARCLAVSGALDVTDFRQIAADLPHVIKQARHLELPWAGHLPSLETPPRSRHCWPSS
ncbi:MAG TPA: hypothetical protein VGD84_21430 [Pseudonocardiaceae bacterium]